MLPDTRLRDLTPNLIEFRLGVQYRPAFHERTFLKSLPDLQVLHLPPNVHFSLDFVEDVPKQLTELAITICEVDNQPTRFTRMDSLKTLVVRAPADFQWPDCVPPSVMTIT